MKATMTIIWSMLCVISFARSGSGMCNTSICLDWELDVNKLTLTCRIKHIHLRVFIDDPFGNMQAVCLPPYPFVCEAYYKYGSISYSSITKEIKFIVKRGTNQKVEGYWTCRHGTGRDISKSFVSMRSTIDSESTTDSHTKIYSMDERTTRPSTALQTSSYRTSKIIEFKYYSDFVTVNEEFQTTQYMSTEGEREKTNEKFDHLSCKLGKHCFVSQYRQFGNDQKIMNRIMLSKFYGLFIGAAFLLLFMFVVCNIWISRRCRDISLKIEDPRGTNHSNETVEHEIALNDIQTDEVVDKISDYESINENEVFPFPSDIAFRYKESSLDTETFSTSHSSKLENTSSSDNSYLVVIDDDTYLNPYESIQIRHESEIVHDYCTTSNINFLETCSPGHIEKPPNNQYSTCDTEVIIDHDKLDVTVQSESPACNASSSEKTLLAIKPDNNETHDSRSLPSHAMSTLL